MDGTIYIAGKTDGDFDDQTNNEGTDAFISKFYSDGEKAWTRLLGSEVPPTIYRNDYINAITISEEGSIYVAGGTNGNLDGQTNKGDGDAFISRYNPDGSRDWSRLIGIPIRYS